MTDSAPGSTSKTVPLTDARDCGILIAFEGPDGSGKTTQHKLLKSWLQNLGADVVVTKWNSSPLFKPLIKAGKAARLLDPLSYSILHAADFLHRYETIFLPALRAGKVVLADRYLFTGIARDIARGMTESWCCNLYSGFRKPDLVFYFRTPTQICADRITSNRSLKFYEAGQDVTGLENAYESYLCFTPRVISQYDRLHSQFGFVVIDGEKAIYEQHRLIRESYLRRCAVAPTQPVVAPAINAFLSGVDV